MNVVLKVLENKLNDRENQNKERNEEHATKLAKEYINSFCKKELNNEYAEVIS